MLDREISFSSRRIPLSTETRSVRISASGNRRPLTEVHDDDAPAIRRRKQRTPKKTTSLDDLFLSVASQIAKETTQCRVRNRRRDSPQEILTSYCMIVTRDDRAQVAVTEFLRWKLVKLYQQTSSPLRDQKNLHDIARRVIHGVHEELRKMLPTSHQRRTSKARNDIYTARVRLAWRRHAIVSYIFREGERCPHILELRPHRAPKRKKKSRRTPYRFTRTQPYASAASRQHKRQQTQVYSPLN
jgi:hypothetical protein